MNNFGKIHFRVRRLLRIIFNVLTAASVLLAIWFYLAWALDLTYHAHTRFLIGQQRIELMWHEDGLLFELTGPWPKDRLDDPALLTRRLPWLEYLQPPRQWKHAGILYMHGPAEFASEAYHITASSKPRHLRSLVVLVSTRTLVSLLCILPLAWLIGGLRKRRRNRQGFCADCGYDMRATPTRCPECGRPGVEGRTIDLELRARLSKVTKA